MNAHFGAPSTGLGTASVSRRERLVLAVVVAVAVPSSLLVGGFVSLPSLVEHGIEWLLPGHSQSTARGTHAGLVRYSPMSIGKGDPAAVNGVSARSALSRKPGHARHAVLGAVLGAPRPHASHAGSGSAGSKAPAATGATAAAESAPPRGEGATSSPSSDGGGKATSAPPAVTVRVQGPAARVSAAVQGTHVTGSASVSAAKSAVTADVTAASGSAGVAAAARTPAGDVTASANVAALAASATVTTPVASATVATPSATPPAASATVATPVATATVATAASPTPHVSLPLAITP